MEGTGSVSNVECSDCRTELVTCAVGCLYDILFAGEKKRKGNC